LQAALQAQGLDGGGRPGKEALIDQARARLEELKAKESALRRQGRGREADGVAAEIEAIEKKMADAGVEAGDEPASDEEVEVLIKEVVDALAKAEKERAQNAIQQLGGTQSRKAAMYLVSLLGRREESIRAEAARAIGRTGVTDATSSLLKALRAYSKQNATALACLDGLGDLKDKRATSTICGLMKYSDNWDFIDRSCIALEKIRDRRSVPELISTLKKNEVRGNAPRTWKQRPVHARLVLCLKNLTGVMAGAAAQDWSQWYQKNKNTFEIVEGGVTIQGGKKPADGGYVPPRTKPDRWGRPGWRKPRKWR
jgi:HEAT repeat protein